jgi:predicted transcriptional regulator
MSKSKTVKPTESELEILQVLWNKGEASVKQVHEKLSKTKSAGYTTTLKLMQIMFEKGLVDRDSSSRTHIYTPSCDKENTQKELVGKFIRNAFGGSSSQLVLHALGNHKINPKELDEIQQMINQLKKK